jgi:Mrp family chromosome partitioning ATPase
MDRIQAIVLRALLVKDTWFSLQGLITENVVTDPDARKILGAIKRLHGVTDDSISLSSVRLDIESTFKMNDSLRESILNKFCFVERAELLSKSELEPVVRKYVAKEKFTQAVTWGAQHIDDESLDVKHMIELLQATDDMLVNNSETVDDYKMSGAPEENRRRGVVPLGFSNKIDGALGGGVAKGELAVILAPGGRGKTSIMTMAAVNAAKMGLNVLIVGLEIHSNQYMTLIDKALTGLTESEVVSNPLIAIRKRETLPGNIWVKDWSAKETTVNDIRNLLISLRRQGKTVDYLLVDYWGIVEPERMSKEWRFSNRDTGKALRRLASEFDVPLLTGWQANREGERAYILTAEHIGEDISVKQTSDIIITLNQTPGERDEKVMRPGILKLRNSTKYPISQCRCDFDRMKCEDIDDSAMEEAVDNLELSQEVRNQ